MRIVQRTVMAACALLTLAFVAACGGGGGGSAPAATTTVNKGVIEKFGSIFVNGVEIKTVGARLHLPDDLNKPEVELQNEVEIQNHLRTGMLVTVKDVVDNNGLHKAAEIEFHDNLEGLVDDKGVDFIMVMGQRSWSMTRRNWPASVSATGSK